VDIGCIKANGLFIWHGKKDISPHAKWIVLLVRLKGPSVCYCKQDIEFFMLKRTLCMSCKKGLLFLSSEIENIRNVSITDHKICYFDEKPDRSIFKPDDVDFS